MHKKKKVEFRLYEDQYAELCGIAAKRGIKESNPHRAAREIIVEKINEEKVKDMK